MFYRPAIVGISLLFLFTSSSNAGGGFPKTAQDYATVYEIQIYRQFQGNSAEYRRRVQASQQVIRNMKKAKSRGSEAVAINWFLSANQSGALPAIPAFGASDASGARGAAITRQSHAPSNSRYDRSVAATPDSAPDRAPERELVEPEFDWEQDTADTESSDTVDATDEDVAANDPWSADQLDSVFGDDGEGAADAYDSLDDAVESLVTADSESNSVIKKGSQSATSTSAADTELADDLSGVWGDLSSGDTRPDQLAAVSPEKTEPAEALPTYSSPVADQESGSTDVSGDWNSAAGDMGVSIKGLGLPQGVSGTPGMGGVAPMAMMGGGFAAGIGSLICWVMTMITAFKKKPVFGILSLVTCGLAGLIIGWIKHKEWGITRTMKIWTGCIVLGMACNMAAGFLGAMGG